MYGMYVYIYIYIYIYIYMRVCEYVAYQIDMFRRRLYEYVFVMLFRNKQNITRSMQSKTTRESLPQVPKVNTTDSKNKKAHY